MRIEILPHRLDDRVFVRIRKEKIRIREQKAFQLFTLDNGKRSDYDDNTKTFHLNKLTDKLLRTLDKTEFENNNRHFKDIEAKDETEKMILKSAKDLRLCLKHIND